MRLYAKNRVGLKKLLIVSLIVWISIVSIYTLTTSALDRYRVKDLDSRYSINIYNNTIIDVSKPSEIGLLDNLTGHYLLYFEQRDCPGCKEVSPAIEKYFYSNSNLSIGLVRIHVDSIFALDQGAALRLITRYSVPGTPTLIIVHNGREVSRHIGVFRGDQYEGLKSFIEDAVLRGGGGYTYNIFSIPIVPLGLGIIASISPCSLPMLTIFAFSTRIGRGLRESFKLFITLTILLIPASLAMGLLSIIGSVGSISIYYSVVTYIGVVSLLWGVLTALGKEPLLGAGRASIVLPVLGMQCSFPFILAVISIAPKSLADAAIYSIAFSIGYALPYTILGAIPVLFSSRASHRVKAFRYIQAVTLVSAGLYVITTGIPYIAG